MTGTIYGILVGYDGSACSEQALLWAAREARWHGTVLTICHACPAEHVPAPCQRASRAAQSSACSLQGEPSYPTKIP